ncbi:hypothetical protein ABPG72_012029 [Tetrahymena utriculariae]
MTEFMPIGRQILIDKRGYQRKFFHSPLGIINPLHLTRQKFLEQFKHNVFPPSIPSKDKQCDLDLIGFKSKIHKDDPNQIFQEFNLKDILPQHIARPYIYITKVNKRLTPKEKGTLKEGKQHQQQTNNRFIKFKKTKLIQLFVQEDLKKYNYSHNSDWNKSTNLCSHKITKNSNQNKVELYKNIECQSKEEREEFYEISQKQTQFIFEFYKLLKHMLLRNGKKKGQLKSSVQEFIKKNNKLVDTDQVYFNKQEITDFLSSFKHHFTNEKIESILNSFFSCVYDDKVCLNKISMRALVYNFNRYYGSKEKIEQKFSLAKAKNLNAQIHYDACYWTFNYKKLLTNLKQIEDKEQSSLDRVLSFYGEKLHGLYSKIIEDRNKYMKMRIILAKFFKNSLQVKQILEIEIVAKAFIQLILQKSHEIALFQDFISSYFSDGEAKKVQQVLKKEGLAEYLIKSSYKKDEADVIIRRIVGLYKYAQEEKKENSQILVQQVDKETFLEYLKVSMKKQDKKMSIFIRMMDEIQKYFEDEVEIREIKEKSAKKYEMNMIANFILKYLQKIDRKFLKCQWKIMSMLKLFEENTITLQKLESILNSNGVPSSFTLKFLFSTQVYQKKSNFLCQERQLAQWKIDLQKALGIYKEEVQKMKNFFQDYGNMQYEDEDYQNIELIQQNAEDKKSETQNQQQIEEVAEIVNQQKKETEVQQFDIISFQESRRNSIKTELQIENTKQSVNSKKRISFAELPNEKSKRQSMKSISKDDNEEDEDDSISKISTDMDYLSLCESLISQIKVENHLV